MNFYISIKWSSVVSSFLFFQELQGKEGSFKGYKLMTSVSIPVYNKKNHTVSWTIFSFSDARFQSQVMMIFSLLFHYQTIEVLGLKPNELANPFGQVWIKMCDSGIWVFRTFFPSSAPFTNNISPLEVVKRISGNCHKINIIQ